MKNLFESLVFLNSSDDLFLFSFGNFHLQIVFKNSPKFGWEFFAAKLGGWSESESESERVRLRESERERKSE